MYVSVLLRLILKFGGNGTNVLGVGSRMWSQKNAISSNFSAKAGGPMAEFSGVCDLFYDVKFARQTLLHMCLMVL